MWHVKDFGIYFTDNKKPSKIKNKKGQNSSLFFFFFSFCSIPSSVPSLFSPLIKGLLFIKTLGQPHLIFPFASLDLLYVIHSAQRVLYPLLRLFILGGDLNSHQHILNDRCKKNIFKKKFIYFWLWWVFVAVCRLSLFAASRGLLCRYGARASHCSDFSCSTAQALGCLGFSSCGSWATGSIVVAQGLSCSTVCGIFLAGIKPMSPALAGRFFTYWIGVAILSFLQGIFPT